MESKGCGAGRRGRGLWYSALTSQGVREGSLLDEPPDCLRLPSGGRFRKQRRAVAVRDLDAGVPLEDLAGSRPVLLEVLDLAVVGHLEQLFSQAHFLLAPLGLLHVLLS